MGQAVAIGTAVSAGGDPEAVAAKARNPGGQPCRFGKACANRCGAISYSYRDVSDADLNHWVSGFTPGKRYVSAYG